MATIYSSKPPPFSDQRRKWLEEWGFVLTVTPQGQFEFMQRDLVMKSYFSGDAEPILGDLTVLPGTGERRSDC